MIFVVDSKYIIICEGNLFNFRFNFEDIFFLICIWVYRCIIFGGIEVFEICIFGFCLLVNLLFEIFLDFFMSFYYLLLEMWLIFFFDYIENMSKIRIVEVRMGEMVVLVLVERDMW